jgi:hypothetical protein
VTVLRRLPAILAALLLGAHFFRAGQVFVTAACALAPILLFLPVPRSVLVFRLLLAAAAGVWSHTAWRIAELRRQAGEPYLRMLLILGAVAIFTLAAAAVLPKEKPRA